MENEHPQREGKVQALGRVVSLLPFFSGEFLARLADRLTELKHRPRPSRHLRLIRAPEMKDR